MAGSGPAESNDDCPRLELTLNVVEVAPAVVGLIPAVNVGWLADKGVRLNGALSGLTINSQPGGWRVSGVILVACGMPPAIWAAAHP